MTFKDGIDTDEMIMTGGIKTEAGKNRVVPVCKKIEPFIMHMYNKGYEAVSVDEKGEMLNYDKLYRRLKTFLSDYEFDHIPYECRHTFATMLDNNDTNPKIKKLLLGHSSNDVTEKVYTHKTIEQLREAVNKL